MEEQSRKNVQSLHVSISELTPDIIHDELCSQHLISLAVISTNWGDKCQCVPVGAGTSYNLLIHMEILLTVPIGGITSIWNAAFQHPELSFSNQCWASLQWKKLTVAIIIWFSNIQSQCSQSWTHSRALLINGLRKFETSVLIVFIDE